MKLETRLLFWFARATWRTISGRWFVWRDAPTDVVRFAAVVWRVGRRLPDEALAERPRAVLREARAELRLRRRQR